VPNPRFAADFTDTSRTPRVHIGYLAKEIFGLYRPKRDPFVYVADGGHRDNIGLSELLRKTPKVAFVVDASGDTPGKFTTLNECIALVQLEQGIRIDMTWPPIVFPESGLPDDCATVGTITYRNGQLLQLGEHVGQRMCAIASQLPGYADIGRVRALPDAVPEVADRG